MKTTTLFLLCAMTIAIMGCTTKGDGKQGYAISDLYHTSNQDILEKVRKPSMQKYCVETETHVYGMKPKTYSSVRVHKAVFDGKHLHSLLQGDIEYNLNGSSYKLDLALDGLSYANVSKAIEEGDWFYANFDQEKDRLFFYYVDLNNIKEEE